MLIFWIFQDLVILIIQLLNFIINIPTLLDYVIINNRIKNRNINILSIDIQ